LTETLCLDYGQADAATAEKGTYVTILAAAKLSPTSEMEDL